MPRTPSGGMSLVKSDGRSRVPAGMGFARQGSEAKFKGVTSRTAFGKGMMHSRFKPLQLTQVSERTGNFFDTASVMFDTAGVILGWPQRVYDPEEDGWITACCWGPG